MTRLLSVLLLFAALGFFSHVLTAQEPAGIDESGSAETDAATTDDDEIDPTQAAASEAPKVEHPRIKDPTGMTKLAPDGDVWLDAKNNQVVLGGTVCEREALLEMFACPAGTKEHESIVSVKVKAKIVHAALLATGAKSGKPAYWDPKTKIYHTATGSRIDIHVEWLDKDGKPQRAKAQDWIQNMRTKEAMTEHWVFGGSGFYTDETTGREYYRAESGPLICVSNFPDAMLDLPIESSDSNEVLNYTPFTERIPPRGTRVLLYLKPAAREKKVEKE